MRKFGNGEDYFSPFYEPSQIGLKLLSYLLIDDFSTPSLLPYTSSSSSLFFTFLFLPPSSIF
jgi:hypothetical protein